MFSKLYYERYAAITIADFFSLNIENFKNKEMPDIQNEVDSIGVEVTQAITQHEGYVSKIRSKLFNKGHTGQEKQKIIESQYKKFNGGIMLINEIALISDYKHLRDTFESLKTTEKALIKKSGKYEIYKKFDKNYLYIFLENASFLESEIKEFLNKQINDTLYDGILLNTIDKLYFCNQESFSFKFYESDELIRFKSWAKL